MLNRKTLITFIVSVLILASAVQAPASNVGETISIEGYVDSAGKNSLYVSEKILVANEYSSISTGGTNIFVGDYVMGFIYLNEDMQSYTIVSLTKIPEKSIGTPTPLPQNTPTPVWADLFMTTPTASREGLHLLSEGQDTQNSDILWDPELFGILEITQTAVPTATPSSLAFEGVVSDISGNRIVIEGTEYVFDNATGYKDKNSEINPGDYVRGRAAPYPGALIIRYIEVLPEYERSDLEIKTVWGLYQSQDTSKMIVSLPDGDIEALFFPGTKMSKTFYTKGTLISMDMAGTYVKASADYPLVQSGDELTPINGIIDEIIGFSDNETYFVSSNLAYFVNSDVKFIPDSNAFAKDAPFVGLMKNGRVTALYFTDNNRVKTINGPATSVRKNQAGSGIDFYVGGVEYHITPDTVVLGSNLVRHSEITGYADSSNNVFYMTFMTPWYSQFKDWKWTVILPASAAFLALVFFLLLHRTKTEGFLQEVNGNIITLTDARGENKRHFRCSDEISRYVSSLITMKVELTIYHGKVIHIRYDF
ncbi:MAG: hypothetical protein IJI41_05680 [Anaerolineaceae bacterium]|nr:hypothetical protein [Anaerolineaceae bacterium]